MTERSAKLKAIRQQRDPEGWFLCVQATVDGLYPNEYAGVFGTIKE
jgi:hypothetical protein